jgi:hypothetical protein
MRPIFRGFCINWFGIGPLHNISNRFDFGFELAEIFVIDSPARQVRESATPRLAELENRRLSDSRLSDSATFRLAESIFDYEYLREFKAKIGTARKVV